MNSLNIQLQVLGKTHKKLAAILAILTFIMVIVFENNIIGSSMHNTWKFYTSKVCVARAAQW